MTGLVAGVRPTTDLAEAVKRRVVALLSVGHGAAHWYTGLYSVILPVVAQSLGLSYTQVGFIGAARGAGSSLSSVLGGVLADTTRHRRLLLMVCLLSTAAAYALLAWSPTFGWVLVFFTLGVLGNSAWHTLAMPVLTFLYPSRRAFMLGVHDSGAQIVQSISPLVIGLLLTRLDWRPVLQLNWIPGLAMAGVLWLALPHVQTAVRESGARFRQRLRTDLLANGRLWLVSIVWAFSGMAREGLLTFLPLFIAFELGLSPVWVGITMAVLTFTGALAAPGVGWLADRLGQRTVLFGTLAGGGLLLLALPAARTPPLMIAATLLLGLLVFSTRAVFFASAMGVASHAVGGSAVGLMFFINRGFAALSPLVAGALAEGAGLAAVFYFFGASTLLAGLLVRVLPRMAEGAAA